MFFTSGGLSKLGERLPSLLLELVAPWCDEVVKFRPQPFDVALPDDPFSGEAPPFPALLFAEAERGRGRRFASSFFHFMRRFWNQIFMCLSVKFNIAANSILRGREIYLLK